MADSSISTLTGILAKLNATSALTSIVGTRIYGNVPQPAIFPYVLVTVNTSTEWDTKTSSGNIHTVRIQAFSRLPDPVEALNIRKAVFDTLHKQESVLTSITGIVQCIHKFSTSFKESDGVTWQSVSEFSITVDGS